MQFNWLGLDGTVYMCVLLQIHKDYNRIETLLSREGKLRTVRKKASLAL